VLSLKKLGRTWQGVQLGNRFHRHPKEPSVDRLTTVVACKAFLCVPEVWRASAPRCDTRQLMIHSAIQQVSAPGCFLT
jgi:hypothetical protein